jgi:hypothetical protein
MELAGWFDSSPGHALSYEGEIMSHYTLKRGDCLVVEVDKVGASGLAVNLAQKYVGEWVIRATFDEEKHEFLANTPVPRSFYEVAKMAVDYLEGFRLYEAQKEQ